MAALLTANAFAVAALVGDDRPDGGRFRDPQAVARPEIPASETVQLALVTTADGRTFMADPSTTEGREAIEQARREGATIREVTVPGPDEGSGDRDEPARRRDKAPGLPGLPGLLDGGVTAPGGGGGSGGGGGGGGGGGLVEVDPGLVDELLDTVDSTLDTTQGGLRGVVDGVQRTGRGALDQVQGTAPTPLDGTVDDVQDVVDGTVDDVQDVVDGVVDGVQDVADTVGGPVGGTVGGAIGTVNDVVDTLPLTPTTVAPPPTTPTTVAPPPTTPTTAPCLLGLLFC